MAKTSSTLLLTPGSQGPDFTLPDAAGRLYSRRELAGPRGLLVVFACNHCPYVVLIADKLGELAAAWKKRGVHTVAISSNDVSRYAEDAPELMPVFAEKHAWDFPYLRDESQRVAQAYKAACTPDFFLLNSNFDLFYAGQFDEARPYNGLSPTGTDLASAVDLMCYGGQPPRDAKPSLGCGIKWLTGNEPKWEAP